jgi:hypothetical protein
VPLLKGAETLKRSIEHGLSTLQSNVQYLERMAYDQFKTLPSHQPGRDRALWYWLKALPETEMVRNAGKPKSTIITDALRRFEDNFTDDPSSKYSCPTNPTPAYHYVSDALYIGHVHPYPRFSSSIPIRVGHGHPHGDARWDNYVDFAQRAGGNTPRHTPHIENRHVPPRPRAEIRDSGYGSHETVVVWRGRDEDEELREMLYYSSSH